MTSIFGKKYILISIGLIFTIIAIDCNKSESPTGPGTIITPPASEQYVFYPSTVEDFNHLVTDRYTYDSTSHMLRMHEHYRNTFHDYTDVYFKPTDSSWIRVDHFDYDGSTSDLLYYDKYNFNSNGTIDSVEHFDGTGGIPPTSYVKHYLWVYTYNARNLVEKAQYITFPSRTLGGYTLSDYDSSGRLTNLETYTQSGTIVNYLEYVYSDSIRWRRGEPNEINRGFWGYARYFVEYKTKYGATGPSNVVTWRYEGYPDSTVYYAANDSLPTLGEYYKFMAIKK